MGNKAHYHSRKDELHVFFVPADPDQPAKLKVILNDLAAMQRLVGGYVERVHTEALPKLDCGCGTNLVVNEEGRLHGLLENTRASSLVEASVPIVGDTFLIGEGLVSDPQMRDLDTDWFSLPPEFNRWRGPGHPLPA